MHFKTLFYGDFIKALLEGSVKPHVNDTGLYIPQDTGYKTLCNRTGERIQKCFPVGPLYHDIHALPVDFSLLRIVKSEPEENLKTLADAATEKRSGRIARSVNKKLKRKA